MKYFVVNRGDEVSQQLNERFHVLAKEYGMVLDEREPDTVLSIGGDGTMLQAFHRYKDQLGRLSFVGLHTGRLGFFADWFPEDLDYLAQVMGSETSPATIVEYPLVEIQIRTQEGTETHVALNEFTLKGVEETMVAQLNLNDETFEMFRGDGICISTPSGSTAYNKSLGGALVHPSIESIQIAEIASINNRVFRTLGSSMILPKHHHCDIFPQANKHLLLTLDHLNVQRNDVVSIRCSVANQKVRFARYRPYPFWNRVQKSFIGLDMK
ncbi:NAD kinase [Paenibacillus sp. CC-CFT747]|nr:NAD kinase [Paenibacillus sp. CC-CFT747]